MSYVLEREQFVPRPRSEVFAFFADAANLERITPPTLRFHILTPTPIEMRPGAVIDYRLSLLGIQFRWRTVIEVFEPETRFVDVQASGPYKLWRHTHSFEDAPGGTRIRDRVEYELPFGPLGHVTHALFVRRQLEGIFSYRRSFIDRLFATDGRA
jgi:ligand-binding SRPBCC domain-containing protein